MLAIALMASPSVYANGGKKKAKKKKAKIECTKDKCCDDKCPPVCPPTCLPMPTCMGSK